MKKLFVLLFVALFAIGIASAADNESHTVKVSVGNINEVSLTTTSDITISIGSSDATAGTATISKSNSAMTDELKWTTNLSTQKITVVLTTTAPTKYALKVTATAATGGTAAGSAVTLAKDTAADLITAITTTAGKCTLTYTVDYNVSQGPIATAESNTVKYVITAGT